VIADGAGRAVAFAVVLGQARELPTAPALLDCLPDSPSWVVGDRGYSSHRFRELVWGSGDRPAIPPNYNEANEAPVSCPAWICRDRNLVERFGDD
jgi:hypothetical protein